MKPYSWLVITVNHKRFVYKQKPKILRVTTKLQLEYEISGVCFNHLSDCLSVTVCMTVNLSGLLLEKSTDIKTSEAAIQA